jgi:hypothetical protein
MNLATNEQFTIIGNDSNILFTTNDSLYAAYFKDKQVVPFGDVSIEYDNIAASNVSNISIYMVYKLSSSEVNTTMLSINQYLKLNYQTSSSNVSLQICVNDSEVYEYSFENIHDMRLIYVNLKKEISNDLIINTSIYNLVTNTQIHNESIHTHSPNMLQSSDDKIRLNAVNHVFGEMKIYFDENPDENHFRLIGDLIKYWKEPLVLHIKAPRITNRANSDQVTISNYLYANTDDDFKICNNKSSFQLATGSIVYTINQNDRNDLVVNNIDRRTKDVSIFMIIKNPTGAHHKIISICGKYQIFTNYTNKTVNIYIKGTQFDSMSLIDDSWDGFLLYCKIKESGTSYTVTLEIHDLCTDTNITRTTQNFIDNNIVPTNTITISDNLSSLYIGELQVYMDALSFYEKMIIMSDMIEYWNIRIG